MKKQVKKKAKRIVVKFGTESLFGGSDTLDQETFNDFARQIVLLSREEVEVVAVSSGAIAAGKMRLAYLGKDHADFTKKELASIGTRHIFNMWGNAFDTHKVDVAPILVTYANWEDKRERESVRKSIIGCSDKGIVPIINENDVVSDEEIKLMEKGISENDRLARMIATLIQADGVLFITNVLGVFEKNPTKHSDAKRYSELDHRTAYEHFLRVGEDTSANGRGGITTKVHEAVLCKQQLADAHVAIGGVEKDMILRFARGENVGTRIGMQMLFFP